MARFAFAPKSARKRVRVRRRRFRLSGLWPSARLRRRGWRALRRAPPLTQILVGVTAGLALALAANWTYQVVRKPSELFFPISGALYKTPSETWREYAPTFRTNSTPIMTPELLAALAQVEGSGNPVVRTYWRWTWTSQPFEMFRPASSAVGMYQFTDGTFAEARQYCIQHHAVVEDGPWNNWRSCWFNRFYARVIPAHAVELASAYLDRQVSTLLERHRARGATLAQKQKLAAVIHLCGAGAGNTYVGRGFRLLENQRCGDHNARSYIARVEAMKALFAHLAAEDSIAPGLGAKVTPPHRVTENGSSSGANLDAFRGTERTPNVETPARSAPFDV